MSDPFVELVRRIEELERKLANTLRIARVTAVDASNYRIKARDGAEGDKRSLETDWLPWAEVAGHTQTWSPPEVGQSVMILSPSGEPGQGYALPLSYTDDKAPPGAKDQEHRVVTGGNKAIEHETGDPDRARYHHSLKAVLVQREGRTQFKLKANPEDPAIFHITMILDPEPAFIMSPGVTLGPDPYPED